MGNSSDFFRGLQPLFEAKEDGKKGKKPEWLTKAEEKAEEKEGKKPANVKETAADFFRKYSDIIAEAEDYDDEDPDVAIADKEKGKDKKTQKDSEKGKKWNFEKADKKDQDKSAKKVAKGEDE